MIFPAIVYLFFGTLKKYGLLKLVPINFPYTYYRFKLIDLIYSTNHFKSPSVIY